MKALIASFLITVSTSTLASTTPNAPHIEVRAVGSVAAAPDRLSLSATLEATAKDAEQAANAAIDKSRGLIGALTSLGIAKEQIKLTQLSLMPIRHRTPQGESVTTGYRAERQVSVTLKNLDRYARLVDALLNQGVERINSPNLFIADPADQIAQATQQAFINAKAKAAQLATLSDQSLGKVYRVNVTNHHSPRPMMRTASFAKEADMPFSAGLTQVDVQVEVVFMVQ